MAGFTIFVDESGLFHPRALGHRVVVALVLPLPFEEAEDAAKACLDAALAQGWPRPFHAQECLDPVSRVTDIGRLNILKAYARSQRRDDERQALKRLGADRLRQVRQATARLMHQHAGWFRVCGEHGQGPSVEASGSWPRMVAATLEAALLDIGSTGEGPHAVDVRVAHKDQGLAVRFAPRLGCTIRSYEVEMARDRCGLQLADVLAHALGPGGTQHNPVKNPMDYALAKLRHDSARLLHTDGASLRGSGALPTTHGRVLAALDAERAPLLAALEDDRTRPPPCTLPYASEGSIELIRGLP